MSLEMGNGVNRMHLPRRAEDEAFNRASGIDKQGQGRSWIGFEKTNLRSHVENTNSEKISWILTHLGLHSVLITKRGE